MKTCLIVQQYILLILLLLGVNPNVEGQADTSTNVYHMTDVNSQVNKKRRNLVLSLGGASYGIGFYTLYRSWYEDYPTSAFHFHNDWGEWRSMDKIGHVYSTFAHSSLSYQAWRWTGMKEKKAIWTGVATSLLFQTTIEVMDGFSTNWGFSWSDIGGNFVGAGLFATQQLIWQEQRILMKVSSSPVTYPDDPFTNARVNHLYGSGYLQRWLKDYNGQTLWLSANVKSFLPKLSIPKWLNVSMGYGAENMYGGYVNTWQSEDHELNIDLPRYSQFYISLDADLSKIKTESAFLRTLLDILNVIKVPFSALEINTLGEIKFHLVHF